MGTVDESYSNVTRFSYRLPQAAYRNYNQDDHLRTFGIDSGGNDPGTEIDDRPPAKYKEFDESYLIYHLNGTIDVDAGDEVVARVSNCIANPEEAGWYQGELLLHDRNDTVLDSRSHYYWICECENESEARERLGPPPSEMTTPDGTSTRTPTSTPDSTPTSTSDSTPTNTPASTTATPAPATSTESSPPRIRRLLHRPRRPRLTLRLRRPIRIRLQRRLRRRPRHSRRTPRRAIPP